MSRLEGKRVFGRSKWDAKLKGSFDRDKPKNEPAIAGLVLVLRAVAYPGL